MSSLVTLVSWQQLTASQRDAVLALRIDPVQVEYAGTLERALDGIDTAGTDERLAIAILAADAVVGFLLVKRGSQAPPWASADMAVVASMRVDRRHQGLGHGSAALSALPRWLRSLWPDCARLALSVDEENTRGIAAYARAGFTDSGRREAGRIGWVRYMTLPGVPGDDVCLNTKPDLLPRGDDSSSLAPRR